MDIENYPESAVRKRKSCCFKFMCLFILFTVVIITTLSNLRKESHIIGRGWSKNDRGKTVNVLQNNLYNSTRTNKGKKCEFCKPNFKTSKTILSDKNLSSLKAKLISNSVSRAKSMQPKSTSKNSNNNCSVNLPDCIIIGVQKSGTTALSEFLKTHPQLSVNTRQTYYFTMNYFRGEEWYKSMLPCSKKGQLTIERTPQYFYFRSAPGRIKQMNEHVKLLLIVRDPVKRAISNFAMAQYRNRESRDVSFDKSVLVKHGSETFVNSSSKYIEKSMYFIYLQRWLDVFSFKQIHVVDGESFITNPQTELKKVESFFGINHHFKPTHFTLNGQTGFQCIGEIDSSDDMDCLPKTKGRIHPYVSDRTVALLKEYFYDLNEKFFQMVNRTFQW